MKKYRRFLPAALALTLLCSGAALAATGDKNDPLVTLSYLEQTALPGVVSRKKQFIPALMTAYQEL